MGKMMKGGISYGGTADIDLSNENVVLTVGEMPSTPRDGMTVLYEGDDTLDFKNGHIYQYSETDSEWLDITSINSIPMATIDEMFD